MSEPSVRILIISQMNAKSLAVLPYKSFRYIRCTDRRHTCYLGRVIHGRHLCHGSTGSVAYIIILRLVNTDLIPNAALLPNPAHIGQIRCGILRLPTLRCGFQKEHNEFFLIEIRIRQLCPVAFLKKFPCAGSTVAKHENAFHRSADILRNIVQETPRTAANIRVLFVKANCGGT